MEGKGLICGLPAKNVIPTFRQQTQQQANNNQQNEVDDELKEITRARV